MGQRIRAMFSATRDRFTIVTFRRHFRRFFGTRTNTVVFGLQRTHSLLSTRQVLSAIEPQARDELSARSVPCWGYELVAFLSQFTESHGRGRALHSVAHLSN